MEEEEKKEKEKKGRQSREKASETVFVPFRRDKRDTHIRGAPSRNGFLNSPAKESDRNASFSTGSANTDPRMQEFADYFAIL